MVLDVTTARNTRLNNPGGISRVVSAQAPKPRSVVSVEVITGYRPENPVETHYRKLRNQSVKSYNHAGCKAKFGNKGRVDSTATFHGAEISAPADIDCHKRKGFKKESETVKKLLDSWESRTGEIAPSRKG